MLLTDIRYLIFETSIFIQGKGLIGTTIDWTGCVNLEVGLQDETA